MNEVGVKIDTATNKPHISLFNYKPIALTTSLSFKYKLVLSYDIFEIDNSIFRKRLNKYIKNFFSWNFSIYLLQIHMSLRSQRNEAIFSDKNGKTYERTMVNIKLNAKCYLNNKRSHIYVNCEALNQKNKWFFRIIMFLIKTSSMNIIKIL